MLWTDKSDCEGGTSKKVNEPVTLFLLLLCMIWSFWHTVVITVVYWYSVAVHHVECHLCLTDITFHCRLQFKRVESSINDHWFWQVTVNTGATATATWGKTGDRLQHNQLLHSCALMLWSSCLWNGCFKDGDQVCDHSQSAVVFKALTCDKTGIRLSQSAIFRLWTNGIKLEIICSLFVSLH